MLEKLKKSLKWVKSKSQAFFWIFIIWIVIYFLGNLIFNIPNIKGLSGWDSIFLFSLKSFIIASIITFLILIEVLTMKVYFIYKYMFLQTIKIVNILKLDKIKLFYLSELFLWVGYLLYLSSIFLYFYSIDFQIFQIQDFFTNMFFLNDWKYALFFVTFLLIIIFRNYKIFFKFLFFSKYITPIVLIVLFFFFVTLQVLFPENDLLSKYAIYVVSIIMYILILKIFFYFNVNKEYFLDFRYKAFSKTDMKLSFGEMYNEFIKNIREFREPNSIQLILDSPISSEYKNEDILGHAKIAQNLFDLIYQIDLKNHPTSYSIGIVGEWGIGKSGIVNILKNDWMKGRGDMIFYEFNPWNFDKKDLVEKFFEDLSRELDISNLGRLFKQYSKLISSVEKTGTLSGVLSLLLPEKSLHEIKEEINNKLIENGKRVVISIDDLDRCEPEEVMVMLNLIKNLGGFQNLIYVVSYDKENVLNVLKSKDFGENYLDKIINTELFIPTPSSEQVKNIFLTGIKKILKSALKDKEDFIENYTANFRVIDNYYDPERKSEYSANLNGIFEKENLRFIKKLLNHLNIIFQRNFHSIEDFENKNGLGDGEYLKKPVIDLNTLVLLNYIKLKDYKFYSLLFRIGKEVAQNKAVVLSKEDELIYKSCKDFLKYDYRFFISGVYNSLDGEGGNFRKLTYVRNLSTILQDIEKYS